MRRSQNRPALDNQERAGHGISSSSAPLPPMTRAELDRTILTLAAPAVAENLLRTAVFFSDTLMVGWLRNPAALAAAGLSGAFMYLLFTLIGAVDVSATALVARAWGSQDRELARRIGGQAISLGVTLSIVVLLLGLPLASRFLALMGGDAEVVGLGTPYLRIILAGSLAIFPMSVANGVMRGTGDTRTPMWNTLAMNIWNVAVSFGLVFGVGGLPALGLTGAGWGTATAGVVGCGLAFWSLMSGRTALTLSWRDLLQWRWELILPILRLALPTAGEGAVGQAGYLLFTRMVASLGTATLAAHQIALRIESLSYMPGWGLAIAATTLVGQALGAGDPERAEQATRRTLFYSFILNGLLSLCFLTQSQQIVRIFGGTAQVLSLASLALAISAAELPALGVNMILSGALRGAGDARTPMWVTFAGVLVFRLSLVYVLAIQLNMGLAGVWWGTAADWIGRGILLWLLFQRGNWRGAGRK